MPPRLHLHTNRLRANSFGAAANAYDAHRPRYPAQLIDDVVTPGTRLVLDVGAGTGIASKQLAERGVTVLAVEPDERMAVSARAKGIDVEIATFEDWNPAGRTFDLVVFAASFHWVDPAVALPKVHALLNPGGRLALIWNRLIPTRPSRADFDSVYRDYVESYSDHADSDAREVLDRIASAGFDVTQRTYPHDEHYSRERWLDLSFTYSNQLTLPADKADELRARLSDLIGPDGVQVGGDGLAVIAQRR